MGYDYLRRGRYSASGLAYHVVIVTAGRRALFADFVAARLVVRHLRKLHEEGCLESLAWVLMPDHLHWLFVLGEGASLGEVMRRFKGISARDINLATGMAGPVWQRGYYDHAVRQDEDMRAIARYVVGNPLRAGLVAEIGAYPHWDAVWL